MFAENDFHVEFCRMWEASHTSMQWLPLAKPIDKYDVIANMSVQKVFSRNQSRRVL
jgi:hypothetical protein